MGRRTWPNSSRSARQFVLDNPLFIAFRIRDSWAIWDDSGIEAEYKLWRSFWTKQEHKSLPVHVANMLLALRLASQCEPTETAFCVGCVITESENNVILATGYSRETPGNTHAEEVALNRLIAQSSDAQNFSGTLSLNLYTTMEPCSERLSKKAACVERIVNFNQAKHVLALDAGPPKRLQIVSVYQGVREPNDFVLCKGTQELRNKGLRVETVDPGVDLIKIDKDKRQTLQLSPGWLEREATRIAKNGHLDQPTAHGSEPRVWQESGWSASVPESARASALTVRGSDGLRHRSR